MTEDTYDPAALEDRWRDRWAESGRYEADPSGVDEPEDKTFVTVPYPYPSGGMHVGHARTYTVPDAYARYRRQQGAEVCFPIAWHVTGTPIVGAVERLKKGEESQLSTLRDTYNVPEDTLSELETPMGYARYFIDEHYRRNMQALGLSIDWRRQFTTNDERYSKFITWQYETLREHGRLEKGLHPVKFCTDERQPVTTHDLLEGEEAEYQEYTLIKFEGAWADPDGTADGPDEGNAGPVLPMATLRPETVRGVTNAFVDPAATYMEASVNDEAWIVAEAAVEKLELQAREVERGRRFSGEDLVGRTVSNPVTGEDLLILPADFVDADNATGIVMSVPAHSPDDWVALQDATDRADEIAAEYGIDAHAIRSIEPESILSIEGYGEFPARDVVESYDVESTDDPALEAAVQEIYTKEFHEGKLDDRYDEFAGEIVEDVREAFGEHYRERGIFDAMYEFGEDVVCRCGGEVAVAEQDTWFLTYGDEEWSELALEASDRLDAVPENTRDQYEHTIDWLEAWPCIRNYGLGTPLPWDDDFVIEPLSDSTIYMAYYTIAHRIDDIPTADLDRAFFDTLFYGEPSDAAIDAGADPEPDERALELREEWQSWYPVDVRFSANDLIQNHLTFFLYHHADLFETEDWPEGITVMGMGLLEGEKMSSSKGHVVLPAEAIERYGADTVRFFLLNSSEPWGDYDWRESQVEDTHESLERFWNRSRQVIEDAASIGWADADGDLEDVERGHVDRWLLSKLQETVRTVTASMDEYETRSASQAAFRGLEEHLRWYRRRADLERPGAKATLAAVLETRLRLLAPFVPFLANELHERLTCQPAEDAPWPEPDPELERPRTELEEERIEALTEDIADIVDVTGVDPETIRVYVAAPWKRRVFAVVAETGPDVGRVMGQAVEHESLRDRGDAVNDLAQDLVEFARGRETETLETLTDVEEVAVYEHARRFLERAFDATVVIEREDEAPVDPADRASDAVPFRPAIYVE